MIFQISQYLKYILKTFVSTPKINHDINRLMNVLDKIELSPHLLQRYLNLRQSLKENHRLIEVSDFGKGSRVFNSNQRKISQIAKVAGISRKNGVQLIKLVHQLQPENILEIGTSLGFGTSSLSLGNPNAEIVTLEGCPETASVAQSLFKDNGFNKINVKVGEFEKTLPEVVKQRKFDLIYFDGNHSYEATSRYIDLCRKTLTPHSVWIFDDIHWSKGMHSFWKEFKEDTAVQAAYENWNWGVVRLNTQEEEKE